MWKSKSVLLGVLFLCMLGLWMLFGCDNNSTNPTDGNDNLPPSLIGNWVLTTVTVEINGTPTELPASFIGYQMTLNVLTDSTFDALIITPDDTTDQGGTYTFDDDSLYLHFNNGADRTFAYSFQGTNLVIDTVVPYDMNGDGLKEDVPVVMKFTKQ